MAKTKKSEPVVDPLAELTSPHKRQMQTAERLVTAATGFLKEFESKDLPQDVVTGVINVSDFALNRTEDATRKRIKDAVTAILDELF